MSSSPSVPPAPAAKQSSPFRWNAVNQIGSLLIKLGVTVVLQRMLTPADFGLVANVMVFAEISQVFVDSGFAGAIIQSKSVNQRGLSSAFWLNLAVGMFFSAALFLTAPLLARHYADPAVTPVARFLSLIYVLQSVALVQRALLIRKQDFKSVAIADISSSLASGACAVIMAAGSAPGAWAIASMYVVQIAMSNVMLWTKAHWRPSMIVDRQELKTMWKYGSNVFGAALFIYANTRIDLFLIGRYFDATQQGYYSSGKRYGTLTTNVFVGIVTKSYFPIFSRIQDDAQKLRKTYFNALSSVSFLSGMLFPALFLIAPDAVRFVIGAKWEPMIPLLQAYLVFSAVHVFNSLNANFLAAIGKPRFTFINTSVMGTARLATVISYFVLSPDPSPLVLAAMIAAFSFAENHVSAFFIRRQKHYPMGAQYLSAYRESVIGWACAGALLWLLPMPAGWPLLIRVILMGGLFAVAYLGVCWLTRSPALKLFLQRFAKKKAATAG